MALIDSKMEPCTMLDVVTVPDGFGGVVKEYRDGAPFSAAILIFQSTHLLRGGTAVVTYHDRTLIGDF